MGEEAADSAALLAVRCRGQHFRRSGCEGRRERAVRGRAVGDGFKRRQSGWLDATALQGRKPRPEGRAGGEPVSYRRGDDGDRGRVVLGRRLLRGDARLALLRRERRLDLVDAGAEGGDIGADARRRRPGFQLGYSRGKARDFSAGGVDAGA